MPGRKQKGMSHADEAGCRRAENYFTRDERTDPGGGTGQRTGEETVSVSGVSGLEWSLCVDLVSATSNSRALALATYTAAARPWTGSGTHAGPGRHIPVSSLLAERRAAPRRRRSLPSNGRQRYELFRVGSEDTLDHQPSGRWCGPLDRVDLVQGRSHGHVSVHER